MQNANVKSLKRFIFALREFDWQLVYLREVLPRNNFQQSFTPKCILHSKYVFATREFEKISSKSFDTRYLSRVERSYEIHDLKNSYVSNPRIVPLQTSNLGAQKKKKNSFRSFQRSALRQISFRFPGNVFSVESFAKRDSYGSSKPTTDGFAFGDLSAAAPLVSDPHDLSICYRIRSPLF